MNAMAGIGVARAWEDMSEAEKLAVQPPNIRTQVLDGISDQALADLQYDWRFWGRPKQFAPLGDWATWMLRAGRGFGKTRSGSGWVHERAMEEPGRWIALIGKDPSDVRDYMIEGPGGFLDKANKNIHPKDRPNYEPSKRRLTWPNGSWATIYSSEEPEQLRGYSGDTAWIDELGKFKNPKLVWDNLQFGMREASSSDRPRRLITTTPKPLEIFRIIEKLKGTVVTTGSSYENRGNLDPTWFDETILAYEGTQFGRQEIHAELLDPEEAGIVKRSNFQLWPANKPLPAFEAIAFSLDTSLTEDTRDRKTQENDPTAGQIWCLFKYRGKPQLMVIDVWDAYLGFPELIERIKAELKVARGAVEDEPMYGTVIKPSWDTLPKHGRFIDLTIIEDKGSGISARQTLAREGIITYPYNPGRASKLTRLHLVSHVFSHGMVWLVESDKRPGQAMKWYEPMVAQLCTFTGEGSIEHDDHVDAATQAVRYFLDRHLISVSEAMKDIDPHVRNIPAAMPEDARRPWSSPMIKQSVYGA